MNRIEPINILTILLHKLAKLMEPEKAGFDTTMRKFGGKSDRVKFKVDN